MHRYILRRLLLMLPTFLGVAMLVFLLMRVIPGDIVELRFAEGQFFNKDLVAKERARLGLDRPVWRQFIDWVWGIVRLDFGLSMWSGQPIAHEIAIRLQFTLQLAVMATGVAVFLAIPLGTLAALKQDNLGRLYHPHLLHRWPCHPLVLARHADVLGVSDRVSLDPADGLRAAVAGPLGQSLANAVAGPRGRLSVLCRLDAHDPLRHA